MSTDSRAANQTKTEPFPASATESEATTPGADHPQAPAGTAETAEGLGGITAPGTAQELPPVEGLHVPEVDERDTRS